MKKKKKNRVRKIVNARDQGSCDLGGLSDSVKRGHNFKGGREPGTLESEEREF